MTPETIDRAEPALLDSVSGLNEGQRQALEVAETARDAAAEAAGFAGGLFLGSFDRSKLDPFPRQGEEDRAVGDAMVKEVSEFLLEHLDAEAVDETRTIPDKIVTGLQALGVFRMKVPVEYGGLGFSQVNYNRVLMAIASHCGSTAVLVSAHQSIGVPQPLKMFGTPEQKERFLRRIAEGAISAFALTEPEVGSDPARMSTKAELSADGSHYVLNGVKQWTTNGPIADLMVVMAQTRPLLVHGKSRPQITAFVVEADSPGVETLHRCDFMGLRGIQNGLIRFTDVKVPAENVIWGEGLGLKLALRTLNTGRLTLPAACTGMGKQCLSVARRWGKRRVQWGLPIGEHEAGSEKVADIAATTFAMEAVTWLTSHWADEGRDIRIDAAMAKLFCSEAAWRLIDETLQLRGGRGYERARSLEERGEDPWPLERMLRDCRINTIIEGTSDIMRLFLAREALDPHLKRAADVLSTRTPLSRRLKAAGRLLGHYAAWYPRRLLGAWNPAELFTAGRLARHDRFVGRNSNRLATALVSAMGKHRQKLERRQLLLGHLMDAGTELFAMAATCAWARSEASLHRSEGDPMRLADLFCRGARRRIQTHFRDAKARPLHRAAAALARAVLEGRYAWLEKGVIPFPDAAPAPGTSRAAGTHDTASAPARKAKRTSNRRRRAPSPE